ncbi:glycosyltransferase 61 family protein [Actibacterium sp. MT2.3-13A]|uniref:glycosyltransferase family 61 protein n=1 Tax=Actibacterium sp. MT2.3-13A TaxID=2828332 RepID=UPI001BAE08D1|nr:glycosyltransferase 61 family protein [Actibacterium sp. MT2.3-13A]
MPGPADLRPDPAGGWSSEIVTLKGAQVVPPNVSQMVQPAGVLDADARYVGHGALWRGHRPITTEPAPADPLEDLPGRWIWGGVLWAHFGHFLAESTARLWALDHAQGPVDGILYIPKRPRLEDEVKGFHNAFLGLLGCDLPIRVAHRPTRVEELIVPGQGFGLGAISAGTEPFRATFRRRFGAGVAPDGPERLYISRSALGLRKGGILGEENLEARLAEQGYEIFHPQQHDMRTQIARYKAAKQVVAADGSALHLFAMVGRPEQQVGVVLRRSSNVADNLITHLTHFCGRAPVVIDALRREWVPEGKQRSSRLSFGELALPKVGRILARHSFIENRGRWQPLTDEERQRVFTEKGLTGKRAYIVGRNLRGGGAKASGA